MPGTVIAGSVSIEVDPQEIEAKIRFVPSQGGEEWNVERVLHLVAESRISPPPSARALEDLLGKFAKVKDHASAVIVRGAPPEESWESGLSGGSSPSPMSLPSPPRSCFSAPGARNFSGEGERRSSARPSAEAFPPAVPPPKEEVVVTYDKKETREAVIVNTTVRTSCTPRRAEDRHRRAAEAGKAGENVFGKPIPSAVIADPGFLLGEGIERDKNELRATVSGWCASGMVGRTCFRCRSLNGGGERGRRRDRLSLVRAGRQDSSAAERRRRLGGRRVFGRSRRVPAFRLRKSRRPS
jgi:hypothetical protein